VNADLFASVRPSPSSLLGRCLDSISNPRKHRWKKYLRACRRIPRESPVHGSTNFHVINARRHDLIDAMYEKEKRCRRAVKESPEYKALDEAVSAAVMGQVIASSFLLSRLLRKIQREHPPQISHSSQP